jgi:arylsulfatase A-like enzyme
VRLENFYVSPSCSPTRAALLTGMHEFRSGVTHTQVPREELWKGATTLQDLLAKAGYRNGWIGKWHLSNKKGFNPHERGFEWCSTNEGGPREHFDPVMVRNGKKEKVPGYREDIYFNDAMDFISETKDKPWFLGLSTYSPHDPLDAPEKFVAPFRGKVTDEEAKYLGMVTNLDYNIGRMMAFLKEKGLDENTIVVLTGDHGYQLGEHGLWAKQTLFEGANHVPLIIAAPGVKPGARSGLAEQVDIYPTLCDLAGLPKPKHLQGRSLKPMLDDPAAKGKQVAISTMSAPHTKQRGHSLRTDAFRYVAWEGGEELLYDLRTDADELHNLAKQPAQAERTNRMRERLATHLKSVVESSGLK